MTFTITNSQRHMTYGYSLKQPMPMCEIKIIQLLYKNPQLRKNLIRFNVYPFIQKYSDISAGEIYIIYYFPFYTDFLL